MRQLSIFANLRLENRPGSATSAPQTSALGALATRHLGGEAHRRRRACVAMRVWRTFSRFPCTAEEYFELMLAIPFQERLHVDGLKMGLYRASDTPADDGRTYRVAFAEPKLNLPAVLARLMAKAQAYHEHTHYDPRTLGRHVKVVPSMGAEYMDFKFTETVRPDRDGVGGCVAESVVRVHCDGGWIGRLLERFICTTSKVKLDERDTFLNNHFDKVGITYETATVVEVRLGVEQPHKADFSTELFSHPLPRSTFERSAWGRVKSAVGGRFGH